MRGRTSLDAQTPSEAIEQRVPEACIFNTRLRR
jgi:hypothetical protein